ncbi:MAG: M14 family metallocarboxypeptidase [Phycisphaerales bacterium]
MRDVSVFAAAAAAALVLCSAGAAAKDPDRIDVLAERPGVVRYDGHRVVRVTPSNARELAAVATIAETVWSHRVGVGPIDVQVTLEGEAALREIGLEPVLVIPDVQALIDSEWAQIQNHERARRAGQHAAPRTGTYDETFYQSYQQLADIHARMSTLATARPDIVSVSDIGDSLEARDILAFRITGPDQPGNLADDRPIVFWQGGQHAREWVSPATVMYIADQLIERYDTDSRVRDLVDNVDFRIVPVVNPDGYVYTWTNQRLWRKNRRNGYGVDLNRNWSYEWGGDGSSGSTSSDIYRGPAPFSEPETAAIRDYATAMGGRLAAAIDYHSFSQLVLWPFGYADNAVTPEPDRTFYDNLATDMSDVMLQVDGAFYDPIQSWMLYPAAGVADDWFYGDRGAWALTIELRDTGVWGFELPANQILPTGVENFEAALLFAERTTTPMSFAVPDRVPASLTADAPTLARVEIIDGVETLDPASPTLYTRPRGGSFVGTPMTLAEGVMFEGELPATPCGDVLEFYFAATTTEGSVVTLPLGGASAPFSATATLTDYALDDTMETDLGWTVGAPGDSATTGVWERTDPQATGAQPENDHTPAGALCWITEGAAGTSIGSFDIDGGATTLTSPTMDGTAFGGEAWLTAWLWYSNNQGGSPNEDSMSIQISNNGGSSWTTLETYAENNDAWTYREYRVAEYVAPTDQLRVRFVASDFGGGSIVEAGVDDVTLEFRGCPATNFADCDGNGSLNVDDVDCFVAAFLGGDLAGADCDGNGSLNVDDVDCFVAAFLGG